MENGINVSDEAKKNMFHRNSPVTLLKRSSESILINQASSSSNPKIKSQSQREREYQAARDSIFNKNETCNIDKRYVHSNNKTKNTNRKNTQNNKQQSVFQQSNPNFQSANVLQSLLNNTSPSIERSPNKNFEIIDPDYDRNIDRYQRRYNPNSCFFYEDEYPKLGS